MSRRVRVSDEGSAWTRRAWRNSRRTPHRVDAPRRAADKEGRADAAEAYFDPAVVLDTSRSPFPDAGVYRGRENVRAWFDGLAQAFGDIRYDVEAVRDFGDQVAALVRVRGRGPHSGIDVEYRFAPLFTVRNGKIVRIDRFTDLEEAVEAVGLSE